MSYSADTSELRADRLAGAEGRVQRGHVDDGRYARREAVPRDVGDVEVIAVLRLDEVVQVASDLGSRDHLGFGLVALRLHLPREDRGLDILGYVHLAG